MDKRVAFPTTEEFLSICERNQRRETHELEDDRRAGCKKMTARLGPGSLYNGKSAIHHLPSGMILADQTYRRFKKADRVVFIAGHMLNQALGGDGDEAKNLTILTSAANSSMKNYDNPVKDAVAELRKLYIVLAKARFPSSKIDEGELCINLTVEASSKKWTSNADGKSRPPDSYIAEKISYKATFVDKAINWAEFFGDLPATATEDEKHAHQRLIDKTKNSYDSHCTWIQKKLAEIPCAALNNTRATLGQDPGLKGPKKGKPNKDGALSIQKTIAKKKK